MPELPEVEVTRRGIVLHVSGERIKRVEIRVAKLRWPVPMQLNELLHQRVLQYVERRGKYLLFAYDIGWLIIHLGMTGTLRVLPHHSNVIENIPAGKHDHIDLVFNKCTLRFRDPRRFGAVLWHPREAGDVLLHPLLARLGIEPFDPAFDGTWLYQRTRGRSMTIKQVLLSGTIVVGVGNIYASESLFRAGIHPMRSAQRISKSRYERLAVEIRATLAAAIEKGGSTLRDFVGGDGERGYFQQEYFVYALTGMPCRVCGTPVRQIVQGQRSTYYCPCCQR